MGVENREIDTPLTRGDKPFTVPRTNLGHTVTCIIPRLPAIKYAHHPKNLNDLLKSSLVYYSLTEINSEHRTTSKNTHLRYRNYIKYRQRLDFLKCRPISMGVFNWSVYRLLRVCFHNVPLLVVKLCDRTAKDRK